MDYGHDLRLLTGEDGEDFNREVGAFYALLAVLPAQVLESNGWVGILLEVAEATALAAKKLEAHAEMSAWHMWLNEGPGKGLRRQHRMSRASSGWIPTLVAPLVCRSRFSVYFFGLPSKASLFKASLLKAPLLKASLFSL